MRSYARSSSATFAGVAVMLSVGLVEGVAAQIPATVTAELAYRSEYLFAGIPFAADGVTHATVTVGVGSITLNARPVYYHDADGVEEIDLWGDYYAQLSPVIGGFVGAGLYAFHLPADPGDPQSPLEWQQTPELYAGVTVGVPLAPTLMVAHDFDLGDGTHVTLLLSQSMPLGTSGASLELGGTLDYNDGYYSAISGLGYMDVSAAVGVPVGPIVLRPMVLVQRGIDDYFVDEELFGVSAIFTF